ncbi:MAG TPA: hypothetical protein GX507_03430 [Clostridia bacterium]|nr:hypothetical protein [Clostridia bacterium]
MLDDSRMLIAKAAGSLAGVAIGDAMGMPVEFLSRSEIRARFGRVNEFLEPPQDHMHRHVQKGSITDDTQQTLALASALIEHGRITPEIAAQAYLRWADETDAFRSSFLGPSSKDALLRLRAGEDPRHAGGAGSTVGAAMRVAPIGIVNAGDPQAAASEAYLSCLPTHGASVAIAGACAVAAAVASAMVNASLDELARAALSGAEFGQLHGIASPGPTLAARLVTALQLVTRNENDKEAAEAELIKTVGVGIQSVELVPTAIALVVLYEGDPRRAIPAAVNMGGDTDTLAAMVGAITGAIRGIEGFPAEWVLTVQRQNALDFCRIAHDLIEIHERRRKKSRAS